MGSHDEEPEWYETLDFGVGMWRWFEESVWDSDLESDDRLSCTHPPGVFPALIQCRGPESPLVTTVAMWSSTIVSFDRTNTTVICILHQCCNTVCA